MSKVRFITILQAILITLTAIFVYVFLNINRMLTPVNFFKWFLFWWVLASLLSNTLFSNKFCQGVVQEWLFYISSGVLISSIISSIEIMSLVLFLIFSWIFRTHFLISSFTSKMSFSDIF